MNTNGVEINMAFKDTLNQLMAELRCTAKLLSAKSGVSMAQLSRYRNGLATPTSDSDVLKKMAEALGDIAQEKQGYRLSQEDILNELKKAAPKPFDYETFSSNYRALVESVNLSATALSRHCNYDASNFARIMQGEQRPRDPELLIDQISQYVSRHYFAKTDQRKVFELMGIEREPFEDTVRYAKLIHSWLAGGGLPLPSLSAKTFFQKVEEFDYEEFLHDHRVGRVKVPTVPFAIPSIRTYEGIEGMKKCVISFLKATALSSSKRDACLYSDHSMSAILDDPAFIEQWMRGIGAVILKGIHINIIHNVNRPLNEIMLALEAWIPVYMTGQVSSYYLPMPPSSFSHLTMVSGAASVEGEAIVGHYDAGRYTLAKANEEVARQRIRVDHMLDCAKPLMETFRKEKKEGFSDFVKNELFGPGHRVSYLSAPPLYLMSEELFNKVLSHNELSKEDEEHARRFWKYANAHFKEYIESHSLEEHVAVWSHSEFNKYPVSLSLSLAFVSVDVRYLYQEYLDHLAELEEFAKTHENYHLSFNEDFCFRNIQINVGTGSVSGRVQEDIKEEASDSLETKLSYTNESGSVSAAQVPYGTSDVAGFGEYVLLSKNKAPTIHFLIRHPLLIEAMKNLSETNGMIDKASQDAPEKRHSALASV